MKKILLTAYACEPNKGSEPGVGWNWAVHLSKYVHVTVITRANNKPDIKRALTENSYPDLDFIYYDIPILNKIKKIIPFGVQLYYLLWEFFVINKIENQHFDVIQRITFVSTVSMLRLYKLKQPYIMSFCAGGETTPPHILQTYSLKYRILEKIRLLYNAAYRYNPVTKALFKGAKLVVAVTKDTKNYIEKLGFRGKVIVEPAIGLNAVHAQKEHRKTYKMVYAGSIIYWKNVDIIVKTMSLIEHQNVQLNIFGAGNDKAKIVKWITKNTLDHKITLNDSIPRNDLLEKLSEYDLAVHASSHDSGSMFLLEAISTGVPVLFLDTGGPKEIFARLDYPLKVNPNQSYEAIVRSFADKIEWFYENYENFMNEFPKYRQSILQKYDWDQKARRMVEIYQEVLNENTADS